MKYVLLAIIVLFAGLPLPSAGCDMHDSQDAGYSQHSNMRDMPMDDHGQGMDCCDHDSSDQDDACKPMSHCGACPTGLVALNPSAFNISFDSTPYQDLTDKKDIQSRSDSPPFRPPIA